jgi:PAS domain S-box-containing protein
VHFFNVSPDSLFIVEKGTGIIIDVNQKAIEQYGYTAEELIGQHNTVVSAEPEKTIEFADNPVDLLPIRYHRKKNGEVFPVEISTSSITIKGKECFFSTVRDITQRIRAEQILRESEQRFRSIFDNAIAGIAFSDANQNIMLTNSALDQMLGFEKGEMVGMNIDTLLQPGETPLTVEYITGQMLKGGYRVERPYLTKQKKPIWVDISASIIKGPDGKPQFFVGVVNDITEKKEAESRLKELVATKDRFISIIAHDLKSPFNAIVGLSELLRESVENKDYANAQYFSQVINASSHQALDLLINLLEWARSQTGRIRIVPEKINVAELVEEVSSLYESTLNQKKVVISTAVEPYLTIVADRNMLSTVIRNLISNAIKYSHGGGKVSIVAFTRNGQIQFSVSDNGVGIASDDLGKLFRADANFTTKGTQSEKGTGLGLVICKDFITRHNGTIWVDSKPGLGSTFSFRIPITYEQQPVPD